MTIDPDSQSLESTEGVTVVGHPPAVRVVDIDASIGQMTVLFAKAAIAMILANVLLLPLWFVLLVAFMALSRA